MPPLVVLGIAAVVMVLGATLAVLRARRGTRQNKPVREPSAFVLLDANAWDACTVDDVCEPWGRYTTEPVRGFCGVPPGRHRIRSSTGAGDATVDFVVYPGEILSFRLDADRARWAAHALDADTRGQLESAPSSATDVAMFARPKLPGWLVHLRTTVGLASARSGPAIRADGEAVDRLRKRFVKLVQRAEGSGEAALPEIVLEARALGESLVGRPLTRRELRGLVAPARDASSRLCSSGDVDRAVNVVSLGLAVLPGDPELMVAYGCALAARGDVDEATRALEAALERDRCLEPEDVARAMRARLELKARRGRSVRVG